MAFGKPFIASRFEAWMDKLADSDAGWFVTPDSSDEIASILLEIAENAAIAVTKGAKGKEFIRAIQLENGVAKIVEALSRDMSSTRRGYPTSLAEHIRTKLGSRFAEGATTYTYV